jgi:hypothetical protein
MLPRCNCELQVIFWELFGNVFYVSCCWLEFATKEQNQFTTELCYFKVHSLKVHSLNEGYSITLLKNTIVMWWFFSGNNWLFVFQRNVNLVQLKLGQRSSQVIHDTSTQARGQAKLSRGQANWPSGCEGSRFGWPRIPAIQAAASSRKSDLKWGLQKLKFETRSSNEVTQS